MALTKDRKTNLEDNFSKLGNIVFHEKLGSVKDKAERVMALAKELTTHSLPEIGDAFGGRDHTTVLHACRKIVELSQSDVRIKEDYTNLMRILSS